MRDDLALTSIESLYFNHPGWLKVWLRCPNGSPSWAWTEMLRPARADADAHRLVDVQAEALLRLGGGQQLPQGLPAAKLSHQA